MSLELVVPAENVDTQTMRVAPIAGIRTERGLPFTEERLRAATTARRGGFLFGNFNARETGAPDEERPLVSTTLRGEPLNDRVLACSIICTLGSVLLVIFVMVIVLWNRVESLLTSTAAAVTPYVAEAVENVRQTLNSTARSAKNIEETTDMVTGVANRLLPQLEDLWNTTANAISAMDAMARSPTISLSAG